MSKPPGFWQKLRQLLWQAQPGPTLDRASRWRRIVRYHLLPAGLYLLITLVISFPLILDFGSKVIGDGGDAWQNIWNYWWTGKALSGRHNPYQTPYLYAPYGVPLYLHSLNLFNALISLPVQGLFGLVAAYNFVVLVSFTLTGYWTYLLVSFLTGHRRAGFVGGVIFAFSSYQTSQLFLGQSNLFAAEWLPAYAYGLIAANGSVGRRRTLFGLLAFVALVFTMLCDWQYVIFLGLFTLVYTLYACLSGRTWRPLLISALVGGAFVIVALPLVFKTFQEINNKLVPPTADSFVRAYSADLWSFFLPSPRQFLWGGWSSGIAPAALEISHNRAIFLGVLPVLLALLGLARAGWQSFLWVGLALLSFVLALGPLLQVGGVLYADISLPFGLIQTIPGLNVARVPVRFVVLIIMALAVLAGFGVTSLQTRLAGRLKPPVQLLLGGGLVALLLAEHLAVPFPSQTAPQPAFYQQLGASNEPGAVLEISYSKNRSLSLYYQTIHHHPIVGGYLSRVVDYPVVDLPPLTDMPNRDGQDITILKTTESDLGATMLNYEGVRWIVILLKDPQLDRAGLPAFLARYAQPQALYRDDMMEVYRPKTAPDPTQPTFFVETDGGWHQSEPSDLAPTHRMRWFERRGGLYVWNISGGSQNASLSFDVWSFHQPRHFVVRYDGVDLGEWTVSDLKHLDIPITMTPGKHQVELRSPTDPPTRPIDLGMGQDARPLSFGVSNIELKAK